MNPTDDQVRALLEEAVADVQPRPGLDRIRARTATSSRRARARRRTVAAAVLATAAVVLGVVVLGPGLRFGSGPAGDDRGVAAGPTGRDGGTASGPSVLVYYAGDAGPGLRLFQEVVATGSDETVMPEAVEAAVTGPPADPDYRTLWPHGTAVQHAQLEDGVLSVDLSGPVVDRPAGMSRAEAGLALQQVIHTVTVATRQPLPVTFLVDGRPTPTVLGVPTIRPVAAGMAEDTLSPVSLPYLVDGSVQTSPFTVNGFASAFEATVQWELVRDDGTIVKRGFATADECCTLSPYSFTVTAPPGSYTLVVHDEDVSDGEGFGATQDSKRITVR